MSSDLVKQLRALAKAEWMIGYGAEGNVTKAADRIEALEGEVAALKAERNEADEKCAVALEDCARWKREVKAATDIRVEAEARAERLRAALEAINKGNEQTTYMHLGTALAIARKALEDDKQ